MKFIWKFLRRLLLIAAAVYAGLFAIFYFDLDGKLLFRWVEPLLAAHYDNMERRDPLSVGYDTDKKAEKEKEK